MRRESKRRQLLKRLLRLPVTERMAVIRRAQIRSVKENTETIDDVSTRNCKEILCQLSEPVLSFTDAPSSNPRHANCSSILKVAKERNLRVATSLDAARSPISNLPTVPEYDGGMADPVTLEIFSLRRRVAELTASLCGANNKLTAALESMYSLRRFLQLWIFQGQGESYDQIHGRIRRLESTIQKIEDRNNDPSPPLEIPKRWRKKDKL